MVTREIKAHQAVDNRYVMSLLDSEIVSKGSMKEARLLFTYHKVCLEYTFFHPLTL